MQISPHLHECAGKSHPSPECLHSERRFLVGTCSDRDLKFKNPTPEGPRSKHVGLSDAKQSEEAPCFRSEI